MILVCTGAGALNVLAFAPFGWWPMQIATLAFVFWLAARESSVRRSMLLGWAYGFGWIACGVYWLYISMHRYGGMPAWMAILAVILFATAMGAYAGLATASASWLKQRWDAAPAVVLLMILPATWTLSEWLRGWVFTGFPWIASGYAHSASPLAGFAPIVGVYGLAWLAAVIAGCLVMLPSRKRMIIPVIVIFGAGLGLKSVAWTEASGRPISVRLLQGNVPQEMKFDSSQIVATLDLYSNMIRQSPADLIVTPETALPLFAHQLPPDYLASLSGYARQSGSDVLIGIPLSSAPMQYTNSVIGLAARTPATPSTEPYQYHYDKHHLVPFGEFIPRGFRWFVDMMHIPLGDFTRGATLQAPFRVKDQWVLPNICYEDLFGEEIADQLGAGYFSGTPQASMLLNMSNIAWFGDSIAVPQHLQISQMRALETGRPMLRATNTGTTAVIEPSGKVSASLPTFERGVLTASVQGYQGVTPYILYGNSVVIGLAMLMLAASWLLGRKNRRNSHDPGKNR
ncbi:MAG TPA: apolipoprotein N-acyltransferase [Burkholderiaceae bacterium]|nr:apolipoprotein N-acyltransferase [Burkholderiaceae bacterium]